MTELEIGKITNPRTLLEWFKDREIERVRKYLSGNPDRKKESYIRYIMIALIESECGLHGTGIELGRIDYGYYKREKRRRQRRAKRREEVEI